jgi:hypothetical protein
MGFYKDNFSDYEDFGNNSFSSRKGKKSFKNKGEEFEKGFGNNKKKNKPRRGKNDFNDY